MPDPTPNQAAQFLAELPSYLPPRHERLPDGMTLGDAITGDLIAVCGRWLRITNSTCVNGWVTVRLDSPDMEGLSASEATPVHLTRKEEANANAVSAGR